MVSGQHEQRGVLHWSTDLFPVRVVFDFACLYLGVHLLQTQAQVIMPCAISSVTVDFVCSTFVLHLSTLALA